MKILFSPSEGKTTLNLYEPFDKDSFIFSPLYEKREFILKTYQNYIDSLTDEELNKFFGIKNGNDFRVNIFKEKTCEAIKRYDGVAYDYLQYNLLEESAKRFIRDNVLIFSNLFGPVLAKDKLPLYRMKQGSNLPNIDIAKYYKENFSKILDEYLKDEIVIDLRAGHYDKFYKPKNFITMKFIKNNKVVSHWAKAYRGIMLKNIAQNQISNKEELLSLEVENLSLKEIQETKNKTTIVYEIKE